MNRGTSNFTMIKEVLMAMLLSQFSNGENVWVLKNVTDGNTESEGKSRTEDYFEYGSGTETTTTTDYTYFKNCIDDGGEFLGRLKKICIQKQYKYQMQYYDNSEIRPLDFKTELLIEISNFQVIQIDTHTITLSMNMKTVWWEYRLELDSTAGPWGSSQMIYLSEEDHKEIWSPKIVIGSNMVSEKRSGVEFGFKKDYPIQEFPYQNLATMKFYLGTTVTCDMDFQEFPFDKHFCEIEVSS